MLIANERISYPYDPDLVAELEVFRADSTLGAVPEYTLEVGHNAAIKALCLVTYDQSAADIDWTWATVYWLHDDLYDDSCVF